MQFRAFQKTGRREFPVNPFWFQCLSIFVLLAVVSCSGKKEIRPDAIFDAEKSLARASEMIDKKDYEDARKVLLEVKNRDLTKKYAPLAQLKIADSHAKEEDYDLAVAEYKKFLEIYPDHKYAPYAQYQIGMAYFVQIESPERGFGAAARALEEFEKLKRMFPRNPYREALELRIEKCKTTIADYEFLVAEFYYKKGSCNAALDRFRVLLLKFPEYKKEPIVLLHSAMCLKKSGEKDNAREYLTRLMEKYPNDKLFKEAQKEFASLSK